MAGTGAQLYRPVGAALLRAAVVTAEDVPAWFPDPGDVDACRSWLGEAWSPWLSGAIGQASSGLAEQVEAVLAGRDVGERDIRRVTLATARYVLRAVGRPTPFGLFAGVAPVSFGPASVRWGAAHCVAARADTQWLADVVEALEATPELVDRLRVMATTLAVRRGGWLEAPHGQNRVRVRNTAAVAAALDAAARSITFGRLAEEFDLANEDSARAMLAGLLRQGLLVTELRASLTVVDPLRHVVERLRGASAGAPVPVVELEAIRREIAELCTPEDLSSDRYGALLARMRCFSPSGRSPLAVDVLLDADVVVPESVGADLAGAAGALLHLSRHPAGSPVWRGYHAAFCERYGIGTPVDLGDVLNPDTGLGYPATYPGSVLPAPPDVPTARDGRLLKLAWQAMTSGWREVVLTDDALQDLAGGPAEVWSVPPHVELAARVHAASTAALDRGEYTLTVAPARAGGVLTSRFTPTMTGSEMAEVYRQLPTGVAGALRVQLSFPPAYPHAENICRLPAYLPHVISLGEYRPVSGEVIPLDDLAVLASRDRLFLVSRSRRQVVEPQVFHALAMDKQAPPLARFLAYLPRAFSATWTVLDWGPLAEELPYLPRVRYRRGILTPARWRLTAQDLGTSTDQEATLARWRERWGCPEAVDLREDERTLRLHLDHPLHVAILAAHLARHGHAVFTEVAADLRWLGGHAHEIAVPLVTTQPAQPHPVIGPTPPLSRNHGQLPGTPSSRWLYAKLYAHPSGITRSSPTVSPLLPQGRAGSCATAAPTRPTTSASAYG